MLLFILLRFARVKDNFEPGTHLLSSREWTEMCSKSVAGCDLKPSTDDFAPLQSLPNALNLEAITSFVVEASILIIHPAQQYFFILRKTLERFVDSRQPLLLFT